MKQPKMNYKISSKGSRASQGLKRESFNHLIDRQKHEVEKEDFNLNAQAGLFNRSALEQNQTNKITPMPKGCNVWDVESDGLTEKQELQIFQHLEDTGQAYSLQGWYGRTAVDLISKGKIKPNPKYHSQEQIKKWEENLESDFS